MIARLQRKLVAVSAVSVLLVFALIFLLLVYFSGRQLDRTMDTLTDAISIGGGAFPDFDPADPARPFPEADVIDEETRFSTRFFVVWLGETDRILRVNVDAVSSISEEQVEEYALAALEQNSDRGWVSDYRFKLVSQENGALLVFVNGAMNRAMSIRLLLTAFGVLLCSALLILALTMLFSRRAVRPMAESYEKQKQFITDASHELKTPLTLILSNVDIVEEETGKSEWLEDIRSESERMRLLVNQMVTLCRMDESDASPRFSSLDLSGLVLDVVSEFEPLAQRQGKGLSCNVEPGLCCPGDEALLRRLAAILLDNSVKYCDAGGRIRVELHRKRHLILTVENTYAGVDSLELGRLFDRFYRADKARTFTGSFGLGLSIARSIVQQHRGSITACKSPGGICFRVELREK